MPKYNVANLLQQLEKNDLISSEKIASFIQKKQYEEKISPYIYLSTGLAAFFSLVFFTFFILVVLVGPFLRGKNWPYVVIIIGIIFVLFGVILKLINDARGNGYDSIITQGFMLSFAFFYLLIGKTLAVIGLYFAFDSFYAVVIGLLIMTWVSYTYCKIPFEQFLSVLATIYSVYLLILNVGHSFDSYISSFFTIFIILYFLILITGSAFLVMNNYFYKNYKPTVYAFVCALCLLITFPLSPMIFDNFLLLLLFFYDYVSIGTAILLFSTINYLDNIIMLLFIIALFIYISGGFKKIKYEPFIIASIGIIVLAFITPSSLMLAILLLGAGYIKQDKILLIIAAILLPLALWGFYYSLNLTLLYKSFVLTLGGIILLLGWYYIKLRGFSQKGVPCATQ